MRKRILPVLISSALLLSGCRTDNKETDTENTSTVTTCQETVTSTAPVTSTEPVSTTPVTTVEAKEEPEERNLENFPMTDGSTSTISLDAYIRAAFLGIPYEEAEKSVVHSKTHQSFLNLVQGEADAIYTVPVSEEQMYTAKRYGVEKFEMVPAAREGFVFVVNANNPVDSLTQEQIRKIYSGEITNWKEVGGNDAEIHAFQRNKDSGSYNYMKEFMGEYELCETKEKSYYYSDMNGMMDSIGEYDNGLDSIGFSVYSFASDKRFENIKFIAVDSIAPTEETLNYGTYPISSYSYFMFRADEPEDSYVRELAEFIQSEEGQDAVERAGLIRTDGKKKGLFISEDDFYTQTGTGHPRPDDFTLPRGFYYNKSINKITDVQAHEMVSEFISRSESELNDMIGNIPECDLPVDNKNVYDEEQFKVSSSITCINKYCSVIVELKYKSEIIDMRMGYFDLLDHRQLELSDFYYEGVNFIDCINYEVKKEMADYYSSEYRGRICEYDSYHFNGLSENCLFVDPCRVGARVYIPYRNPYSDRNSLVLSRGENDLKTDRKNVPMVGTGNDAADDYGTLGYEFADKSVIFEECDVSNLYSDPYYFEYKNAFYSETHKLSKGFVTYPIKSRIINESHLKDLQEAVLKSAERVLELELADMPDGMTIRGHFVDLEYQPDENRFLLYIRAGWRSELKRSYYLDIDTLEFYIDY